MSTPSACVFVGEEILISFKRKFFYEVLSLQVANNLWQWDQRIQLASAILEQFFSLLPLHYLVLYRRTSFLPCVRSIRKFLILLTNRFWNSDLGFLGSCCQPLKQFTLCYKKNKFKPARERTFCGCPAPREDKQMDGVSSICPAPSTGCRT